jgi:hypothetical protein
MIWAATTHLGCGMSACDSARPAPVWVCHYANSPPNYGHDSDYFENVPQDNAPSATEEHCCAQVYSNGSSARLLGNASVPKLYSLPSGAAGPHPAFWQISTSGLLASVSAIVFVLVFGVWRSIRRHRAPDMLIVEGEREMLNSASEGEF